MPARKRAATYDDSSSEDEINMDKVVETKTELDKIRREREKRRHQLHTDLDMKLADLRNRIKQTVDIHSQQLGAISKQQVDRLVRAVQARDAIDQRIKEKLAELQDEGRNLATLLESTYEYRLKKARVTLSGMEQVQTQGQAQAQALPAKKVKIDTSSDSI